MADRRLQIFHAVATHLNFSRAAEALFMSQPAVTLQIKQLEDEYRTRLLERSPHGVRLTPAGAVVFEYATRILALQRELDTRLMEMQDAVAGALCLGAPQALASEVLPPLLAEFNALYPRVRLELQTANSQTLQQRLLRGELALALCDAPDCPEGLTALDCGEDELVAVCDAGHPFARQRSLTARMMADYEYLAREPGSGTRETIAAWFAAQGLDASALKVQMTLDQNEVLKRLVAEGHGFTILSRRTAEQGGRPQGLRLIPLKPALTRRIRLLHASERYLPRRVTVFAELAQRRLRELYA